MKTMERALMRQVFLGQSLYTKGIKQMNRSTRLLGVLVLAFLLGPHFSVAEEFRYIEPEELLKQIEAKVDLVLIDAQPAKKYAEAHIKGAINIAGMAQIEDLDLPYSRPLVIYCDCAGEEASRFLAARLIKTGYKHENVFILKGGWNRWLQLGYPVEKGSQPQL